ncbi:MAG: tetratricopeptide repeat protein, partial [Acinetobacter sp.]|nr:tetratricopeptide repeat protein [Acinetobacter sp.]
LQQDGSPENLAKAEQYFKIALANEPQNMRIHANYGTYLFQMQRYELAIQHLTQAANHLGYEQRAAAYENLGRVYLHLQQFSSAEQAFRQALRIDAQASIAMFELAELLYLQQQFEAAQQWFERYVHSVGQRALGARAYWLGGRLARSLGNVSQQQSYFQMLQQQFAHSAEYQHYVRLKNSADVIWR